MAASSAGARDLYDFLVDAELQHYHDCLKNNLKVSSRMTTHSTYIIHASGFHEPTSKFTPTNLYNLRRLRCY